MTRDKFNQLRIDGLRSALEDILQELRLDLSGSYAKIENILKNQKDKLVMKQTIEILKADLRDIPLLVVHHRKMFEDIFRYRKIEIIPSQFEEMNDAYSKKLENELNKNGCYAWISRLGGEVISSGAVSLVSTVPTPVDPASTAAYVHSIYTEPGHRKGGASQLVMGTIVEFCRTEGIRRVTLHASEFGRSLYEKMGFTLSDNSMSLFLQ